jgi:type I restriction enzyme R subunit
LPSLLKREFVPTMTLLRTETIQDLLVNYPRPQRTFIKANGYEDSVSSAWVVRDAPGHEYKPEDYLEAFARFVKDNASDVDAIGILLNRPKDWGTEALSDLKAKLSSAPQRFTLDTLERAHKIRYNKALVDIISMVKHAAEESQPLLTAEERVTRAFQRITAGHSFTSTQQKWLERIHDHLVANLSIDEDDFENVPVLQNAGGWGAAKRVFNGRLSDLLARINEAIAA